MAQQIHPGDPSYAPPLIRPPSPASSIGTVYGDDETSQSDAELDDAAFASKHEEALKLNHPSDAETRAVRSVLLPRPKNAEEEKVIFGHVMHNLRKEVRRLEEDELFERMLHRKDPLESEGPELQTQPPANDIDVIMQSMMPPPEPKPALSLDVLGFANTLKGHGFLAEEPDARSGLVTKPTEKGKARAA